MPVADQTFPATALEEALHWAQFFGGEWAQEYPDKAVEPRWPADFAAMLKDAPDATARGRTTRVMRKLHRASPRAFEVLYQTMILGHTFAETADWLNERATRLEILEPDGRPVHYRVKDAVALFLVAADFARSYW